LKSGKNCNGFIAFLFGMTLILSAAFFLACETGFDPGSSVPLAGPRQIVLTAKDSSFLVQWTKTAPAQGIPPTYKLYYSLATNTDPSLASAWEEEIESDASNLVTATITGLTNGATYNVWIKAFYAGLGESDFSSPATGMPVPSPATPAKLQVISGEGILQITWEEVLYASSYEVCYQTNGNGDIPPAGILPKTVSETGTALLNVTNGTSYTVWVRAKNTNGESSYATSAGTPQVAAAPPSEAPNGLEITPGDEKLTLTWNQVAGVPSYRLYYGITDVFSAATQVPALVPADAPKVRANITGLENGKGYYIWVQSWNSKSDRDNSAKTSQSTPGTPQAKPSIDFNNLRFLLGQTTAEYPFAQNLPDSIFFPGGTFGTDRLTRVQETALGNLFADGAAWYIRKKVGEDIDFVFLNGGFIEGYLLQGDITVGGLANIVQSESRVDKFMILTMSGTQLKAFFDEVANVVHTGRGGGGTGNFGIVSKEVHYTIRYYTLPDDTEGITESDYYHGFIKPGTLKILDRENDTYVDIDDTREYRICTTDYNASGVYFEGIYSGLYDETKKQLIDTPFWRGVAEYIYDQGTVTPYLDERIKLEGGVPLPPPWIPGNFPKPTQ
jgi:hypothetical protein